MSILAQNLYNLVPDIRVLTKQKYPRHKKREVYLTYIRLFLKQLFFLYRSTCNKLRNEKICGFTVYTYNRDSLWFLFREIFVRGHYAFQSNVETPTIFDCGSNIGVATLFFKWLYPDSTIYAFEPDPVAFKILERNIQSNGLQSVHLNNVALGKKSGTITLYTQAENLTSLVASTLQERGGALPITVSLVPVSTFITQPVHFLKIDTEGAEVDIVKDLCSTNTMHYIQEMVIEYHHNINRDKSELSHILGDIEQSGFTYQIDAPFLPLIKKHRFQDLLLYCYRNKPTQTKN